MHSSEQAPLPDEVGIALQAHLDRLNAAFADFKQAEIETFHAEQQKDGKKLIHLWHAKNQAMQAYMQEWDILVRYGTLSFDERTEKFQFFPNATNNQPSEAE
jgi:hypothetical protein